MSCYAATRRLSFLWCPKNFLMLRVRELFDVDFRQGSAKVETPFALGVSCLLCILACEGVSGPVSFGNSKSRVTFSLSAPLTMSFSDLPGVFTSCSASSGNSIGDEVLRLRSEE